MKNEFLSALLVTCLIIISIIYILSILAGYSGTSYHCLRNDYRLEKYTGLNYTRKLGCYLGEEVK